MDPIHGGNNIFGSQCGIQRKQQECLVIKRSLYLIAVMVYMKSLNQKHVIYHSPHQGAVLVRTFNLLVVSGPLFFSDWCIICSWRFVLGGLVQGVCTVQNLKKHVSFSMPQSIIRFKVRFKRNLNLCFRIHGYLQMETNSIINQRYLIFYINIFLKYEGLLFSPVAFESYYDI